ncbi:MAG: L,D-transpeptidase, partial [Gemmatimonadota bacterium]|nr:L,D-transpeptidase [Gemmatimonadota bacterium]
AAAAPEGGGLRVPANSAAARGAWSVVVDLDSNRLHLVHQRRIVWSAPVGSGTGLRLEGDDHAWDFATPTGIFHVQYKEEVPTWRAPDWFFVEKGLPVPPQNSPKRLFPGGLGAAAVYIGAGLAIHGTNRPELLGDRISHGCIRLANADAQRLFHNVQVGTEVVIVGTAPGAPGKPAPPPKNPWDDRKGPKRTAFWNSMGSLPTPDLLARLDEEWTSSDAVASSRWGELASLLSRRAVRGDEDALTGLLQRVPEGRTARGEEFATFLVDIYGRSTLRVLASLDDLARPERAQAARAIVEATLDLYSGDPDDAVAPWPTSRVPRTAVRGGVRGWEALRDAEQTFREARGVRLARSGS